MRQVGLRRLVISITLFISSLIIGTFGYMSLERYDLVDSFYMAVITLSTVGYGEVHELSKNGRLFSSFYIIMNFGLLAYIISGISSFLVENEFHKIYSNIMTDRELAKLKKHTLVVGYGRNGKQACKQLSEDGKDFIVLDIDSKVEDELIHDKVKYIICDANDDEILINGGIARASSIIICTPNDAVNVFITLTARKLAPSIEIISRASKESTEPKLYQAGANYVVMPDIIGGNYMGQLVTRPTVVRFLELLNGAGEHGFILEECLHEDLKRQYQNKSIAELGIRQKSGATIVGIKDNQLGLIPSPSSSTVLGKNDCILILGSKQCIQKFSEIYK